MPTARLLSGPPLVEFRPDGLRVLQRELVVDVGQLVPELHRWSQNEARLWVSEAGTTVLRVHEGFVYDGASLPSLAVVRWVMGPKERYEVAGALHDPLYRWQAPRGPADRVFWIVARSGVGVSGAQGWAGWAALRVGGWWAYRRAGR